MEWQAVEKASPANGKERDKKSIGICAIYRTRSVNVRVLLAEGNYKVAQALVYVLSIEGMDVKHVASLGEAIRNIWDFGPDVILLDFNLPDSQGVVAVLQMIRAAGGTPIVVLSKSSRPDDLEWNMIKNGIADFLIKNRVSTQDILDAIVTAKPGSTDLSDPDDFVRRIRALDSEEESNDDG